MSYFSEKAVFASKTENGEDNPDENFAQQARTRRGWFRALLTLFLPQILVIDEMRASDIGYSDSKEVTKGDRSQGEASDRVAIFKEMTSHSEVCFTFLTLVWSYDSTSSIDEKRFNLFFGQVSYARNVEHKNQDRGEYSRDGEGHGNDGDGGPGWSESTFGRHELGLLASLRAATLLHHQASRRRHDGTVQEGGETGFHLAARAKLDQSVTGQLSHTRGSGITSLLRIGALFLFLRVLFNVFDLCIPSKGRGGSFGHVVQDGGAF